VAVVASDGASGAPAEDGDIPNDEEVLRRLSDSGPSMIAMDLVTGERRPTSGAFKPDDDGISVYRRSLLELAGLGPQHVVRTPLNVVVGVQVKDLRDIELDVRDDPWPSDIDEAEHPRNAAHALITGLETLGKNQRRRKQKALVALPSIRFVFREI
jgi:hypothetical protein